MRALAFALRALGRDARGGELAVLIGAIWVAVTALTAVGFFTSRVSLAIGQQAGEVLAGDLRLESGRALDPHGEYVQEAERRGLSVAATVSFASVVFAGENSNLALVDGVSHDYPLRGRLKVAPAAFAPGHQVSGVPPRGEAWADSRLLARLDLAVGAQVRLGALTLTITQALDYRPDQGSAFGAFAPTLLLSVDDIAATQLLQPGSRATWSLMFAGTPTAIADYERWLRARKSAAERLIDVGESSAELKSAMDRSARFLSLSSLATLLLAAVAVAMGARRYAVRHLDTIALMKCMGATQRFVLSVTAFELVCVALGGALIGIASGYAAQAGLAVLTRGLVHGVLPPPSATAAWLGLGTALLILLGFAAPPLLELRRVPPARVLRRTLEPPPLRYGMPYLLAAGALIALLYALVHDATLVTYVALGLAATAVTLAAAGWLLVRATATLRGSAGIAWRYGLANVARRGRDSVVQVVAFGLGLTVLLLLAVVRNDLLDEWHRSLPANAPNHFLINIPPDATASLRGFLDSHGIAAPEFSPWVRARLTAINGVPMTQRMPHSDRGRGFVEREQNLSWARELPADNKVIAGSWWQDADPKKPEVSIASEFQEELGLNLGDQLSFDVAGETVVATVSSVRKVRWDGFRPNFFMLFAPGVLDSATGTFMTSVHVAADQRAALAALVRQFPSVTVIDVETLLGEVREIMDRAALAVQYVFAFTLLAGIIVLLAAVQSTRDERRYESAMLRALGASRGTVLRGVAAEFVALGLLSGVLAASAASIAGWQLATRLFGLKYSFDPWLWLFGLGAGAALVGIAGTLAARSVVTAPPALTLRQS